MERRLVVITGASSGIGAAAAREFASAGYPLLLVARRLDEMLELGLPSTLCRRVDITDCGAFREVVIEAEAAFGPVDLLVNNAGFMTLGPVMDQSPDEWRRAFDVNCLALLQATQVVLPGMIVRRHGTIMNVSSQAGRHVYPNHTVYCGTKFAVHALSEGLRTESAPYGVRVIVIAPGSVATNLIEHTPSQAIREDYLRQRALVGGGLEPEQVAAAMRYAYELPQTVCVTELAMAPTAET